MVSAASGPGRYFRCRIFANDNERFLQVSATCRRELKCPSSYVSKTVLSERSYLIMDERNLGIFMAENCFKLFMAERCLELFMGESSLKLFMEERSLLLFIDELTQKKGVYCRSNVVCCWYLRYSKVTDLLSTPVFFLNYNKVNINI